MDKTKIIDALKKARSTSKERKFSQSIDLMICLKGIDLKKTGLKIEEFVTLPKGRGKLAKICSIVEADLKDQADKLCDKVIPGDKLDKFSNVRENKKLARQYDYFLAQATIMAKMAKVFGKVLGVKGKMPNPKAGMVLPPKANMTPIVTRLKNTVKVTMKGSPNIQCLVGTEKMSDEDLAENIYAVFEKVRSKLPQKDANIKNVRVKLTMGKTVKI